MATPSINDLIRYISKKITGANWNSNFLKIVNWLKDGTMDFIINSLTTTSDVAIGGDANITGDVVANSFTGDGSSLTGINANRKNFIINGNCFIKNNVDYSLVNNIYGTSVDRFEGMATGTTVDAGTLTQIVNWAGNRTGYAIKFNDVSITGTGVIYLRYRLYNKDAVAFKNSVGSFSMIVEQTTLNSVPYTIYINKANVLNDFSSVTEIINSGSLGVSGNTATPLTFENVSFGDCSNGLEISIKVECGAITLKDFIFGNLQLELGSTITTFEYKTIEEEISLNGYNYSGDLQVNNLNITGDKLMLFKTLSVISSNFIFRRGNFIFTAGGAASLLSFSVDNFGNFTQIDSENIGDFDSSIKNGWFDDKFIYTVGYETAGTATSLDVFSVDNAGIITRVNTVSLLTWITGARSIWANNNFIFIVSASGLSSFSIDNLGNLTHIDTDLQGATPYTNIWSDGKFIYVTSSSTTTDIKSYSWDISGNLTYISTAVCTGGGNFGNGLSIHGDGNFIYAASDSAGLRSYSVNISGNLTLIDTDNSISGSSYISIFCHNNYIYVNTTETTAIYSRDISGNLIYISQSNNPVSGGGIYAENNFVYTQNSSKLLTSKINQEISMINNKNLCFASTLVLPKLNSTDIAAIPFLTNGMLIYNTTTNKFQGYQNGSWQNLI